MALDVLARFVVFEGVKALLAPGSRVMSVLASTVELPFPPQPEVSKVSPLTRANTVTVLLCQRCNAPYLRAR